jgi:glutamine synthetase
LVNFVERHRLWSDEQQAAGARIVEQLKSGAIELVRFSFADIHGVLRGKVLTRDAAIEALTAGVSMVGTLLLKDTSHHTAFKVFSKPNDAALRGFTGASDVKMVADPLTFRVLPWAEQTAWVQCDAFHLDGREVSVNPRKILRDALKKLSALGLSLRTGLEIEFHIYRLEDAQLDAACAAWPAPAPHVSLIHPGYNLLTEQWFDRAEVPLRIVQRTAQALGLPLTSLEIELGPSQVEAVFAPGDGLGSADAMVLFRSAVKQALWRAGYHATFMCRPPFENIMSSGWHLHQSLVTPNGANAFMPSSGDDCLSPLGQHYLAGLLDNAQSAALFATPTVNGYERFAPNAMAPQNIVWGRDNRGAMLRVLGGVGDAATRIENRVGEPLANPYLYLASQIYSGLSGIDKGGAPPPASETPYDDDSPRLPRDMTVAIESLQGDPTMNACFGAEFVSYYCAIKRFELNRFEQALNKAEWQKREYFTLY